MGSSTLWIGVGALAAWAYMRSRAATEEPAPEGPGTVPAEPAEPVPPPADAYPLTAETVALRSAVESRLRGAGHTVTSRTYDDSILLPGDDVFQTWKIAEVGINPGPGGTPASTVTLGPSDWTIERDPGGVAPLLGVDVAKRDEVVAALETVPGARVAVSYSGELGDTTIWFAAFVGPSLLGTAGVAPDGEWFADSDQLTTLLESILP